MGIPGLISDTMNLMLIQVVLGRISSLRTELLAVSQAESPS